MALNRSRCCFLLALLLTAWPASPLRGQTDILCRGNQQVLWALVREDGSFQAYQKLLGEPWKKVFREPGNGEPLAAAAVGPQLALVLQPRQLYRLDSPGRLLPQRKPIGVSQWPDDARHVALADATNLLWAGRNPFHILVAVARKAPQPEPSQPDTEAPQGEGQESSEQQPAQPDSAATPAQTSIPARMGLIGYTGSDWVYLGDAGSATLTDTSRIRLAVAAGKIYMLISADAQGENRLVQITLARKETPGEEEASASQTPQPLEDILLQTQVVPLPEEASGSRATELMVFPGQLVIPLVTGGADPAARPAGGIEAMGDSQDDQPQEHSSAPPVNVDLLLIDLAGLQSELRPVAPDQKDPFSGQVPGIGRLGENLLFLWKTGETWQGARRTLRGELAGEDALEAFNKKPPDVDAAQLKYYILLATAAVIMTLVILKPRGPIQPFALPQGVRPARLPFRLLAFLIDMVPFNVLGFIVFPWDTQFFLDHSQEVMAGTMPNFIYFMVFTTLGYVAYCIVMEGLYGWTLGKRIFRIRVVSSQARRADFRAAVLRNITKCVELLMEYAIFLLLLPLLNRYRQRVGDILASTTVVDERSLQPGMLEGSSENQRNILDSGAEAGGESDQQQDQEDSSQDAAEQEQDKDKS